MAQPPPEGLTTKQATALLANRLIAIMEAGTLYRITPQEHDRFEIVYYARHTHSVWQPSGFTRREAAVQIVREAETIFIERSESDGV